MSEVVVIGQRPEAVNPESDSLHLGAVEPVAKMVNATFFNLHIGLFASLLASRPKASFRGTENGNGPFNVTGGGMNL